MLRTMWDNQYVVWGGAKQLHIEKLGFVQIIPPNWGVSYHFDWLANRSRTIYHVPIKLIWQAPIRWYYLHKPSFVRYVTIRSWAMSELAKQADIQSIQLYDDMVDDIYTLRIISMFDFMSLYSHFLKTLIPWGFACVSLVICSWK